MDNDRFEMSREKLKQGYLQKYAKGSIRDSWQKIYVELHNDSELTWYKKKNDRSNKGSVPLKSVCEYLTVGSYCRAIPYSPQLPSGCSIEHMIAFPQEPNKKSKIHFFLCSNDQEFNEWMTAIGSTLPPKLPPQQSGDAPIVPTVAYSAYAPPPAAATAPYCPVAGIGFENLSISSQPPPYSSPTAPYPAPSGSQPGYPCYPPQQQYPPQAYAQQPYPPQSYPQQQYPSQPYPQQPYPQQHYPQQPVQQPYHQPAYQQSPYAQQGYPRQPYVQQSHMYPQQPAPIYGAQRTTVIYQPPQPQTVIVTDRRSHGMGNLATGMLGGALAGYAAGRMFGGYGYGYGWGRGSWGSCSWGSGSWGSFSGGSWGSFGGFD